MSFLFYTIIFLSFAHDDIKSIHCQNAESKMSIIKLENNKYKITLPDNRSLVYPQSPEVKDVWNPDLKQLFDTYSFKNKDIDLIVRKPETKGPETQTKLTYKTKIYNCQTQ